MRLKKWVAIMAAVVIAVFLYPAFAQEERHAGTVAGPVEAAASPQATEVAPAETPVQPQVQVVPGERGPQGPQGPTGPRGRPGRNGRTIVHQGHQGHQAPYQHLKTWDPAICSYVDARDQHGLEQAMDYTDQEVEQHLDQDAPSTYGTFSKTDSFKEMKGERQLNWACLWWWLMVLALLALGIWIWWRFIRGRHLENIANFWANRRFIGERWARVRVIPGLRQFCSKLVRNVSAGERYFQPRTDAHEGDVLEYQLRTRNDAHTSLRADGVWVMEDLPEGLEFVPGSGLAYINTRTNNPVAVPNWAIEQLLGGRTLRMDQIPGLRSELPARSSLYLVFRAQVGFGAEDEEIEFAELPHARPAAQAEPTAEPASEAEPEPREAPEEQRERLLRAIRQ
jgi:hypothetical protein